MTDKGETKDEDRQRREIGRTERKEREGKGKGTLLPPPASSLESSFFAERALKVEEG
jgi:hypothetical protein